MSKNLCGPIGIPHEPLKGTCMETNCQCNESYSAYSCNIENEIIVEQEQVGFSGLICCNFIGGQSGVLGVLDEVGIGPTGSQYVNPDTGDVFVYNGQDWVKYCPYKFFIGAGTTPDTTSFESGGPFEIGCNEVVKLWSAGGIFRQATDGSAVIELEPNILFCNPGPPPDTGPTGPDG